LVANSLTYKISVQLVKIGVTADIFVSLDTSCKIYRNTLQR